MTIRKCCVLFAVFSAFFIMTSCRRAPEKRFELKGKVVSVNKAQRQVTLDHEQIPGFMDAMTMPFSVREDWALEALAPGQTAEGYDRFYIPRKATGPGLKESRSVRAQPAAALNPPSQCPG